MHCKHFQLFVHMKYGHIECANKACNADTVSKHDVKYVHTWSVAARYDSLRISSQTVMSITHPCKHTGGSPASLLCSDAVTTLALGLSLASGVTSGSQPMLTLHVSTCTCHDDTKLHLRHASITDILHSEECIPNLP